MNKLIEEFFKFLKDVLPGFLAGFGIGIKTKENILAKTIVENKQLKQKLIEDENKKIIDKKYSGISDIDTIRTIIGSTESDDDEGNTTH